MILIRSRPTWARELKQEKIIFFHLFFPSRPTWARELKLTIAEKQEVGGRSRPTWARELKHDSTMALDDLLGRAPRGRVN